MSKKSKSAITETYTLPSRGRLYGEDYPSEVTIRSMTTFEEKMRLGSQGFIRTMCNLLNAVVVEPEGFSAEDLTLFDFYFLIYKMRVVSYGPEYRVVVTCPVCKKKTTIKVNLDELKVNYLPDDAVEPFKIGPLPRTGDMLYCKHQRVRDLINIERKSKEILDKSPEYQGDPSYILNIVSEIYAIGEEEKLPYEIEMYVEDMPAMDSAYLDQKYRAETSELGLSTECEGTCSCGEELVFNLPFTGEFFRPTFD